AVYLTPVNSSLASLLLVVMRGRVVAPKIEKIKPLIGIASTVVFQPPYVGAQQPVTDKLALAPGHRLATVKRFHHRLVTRLGGKSGHKIHGYSQHERQPKWT